MVEIIPDVRTVIVGSQVRNSRFHLGKIVATPGIIEAFTKTGENMASYLVRHASGDWGELSEHDQNANEMALKTGGTLMSAYFLKDGTKIWIITDPEIDSQHRRYATTFLLPEEY